MPHHHLRHPLQRRFDIEEIAGVAQQLADGFRDLVRAEQGHKEAVAVVLPQLEREIAVDDRQFAALAGIPSEHPERMNVRIGSEPLRRPPDQPRIIRSELPEHVSSRDHIVLPLPRVVATRYHRSAP
jgi:hypothetical protein